MKRIAVLGGTFDPIHVGHLIAGQCVCDSEAFDGICIMPSGNPPHKESTSDYNEHRLEMCRLAAEGNDHFYVSDMEIHRQGKIYTVDTFSLLKAEHPDTEYWLIIGTDSLMNLETWRSPERLLREVPFVVVDRGGYDSERSTQQMIMLRERYGTTFKYVTMPQIELSSTEIRQRISQGKNIRWRIPDRVYDYIQSEGLYRQV